MIVVVTYIKLKSPFKFFKLSAQALKITKQLKKSPCIAYKNMGFYTKHYTQSLWQSEEDIAQFYRSGQHAESMKTAAKLAKEIKTIRIESEVLLDWDAAKKKLEEVKGLQY